MNDRNDQPEYAGRDQEPTEFGSGEPAVNYDPERFPDVREAIDLLNATALLDEDTACIQYPAGDPEQHRETTELLQERANCAVNHGLSVISFDIDLTIRIGEDHEDHMQLVNPEEIARLQRLGHIVGTCSDREPTDQRETLLALGQVPHFCIPKEMLSWAKALIPAKTHLHVGDDRKRDQDMAVNSGWEHQWPDEFARAAS